MGREAGIEVETALWTSLPVGLVVARLGFVRAFPSAYFESPLDILDIRDGGWSPTAGFVGAWLFALSRPGHLPALKKALRAALLTGTVLWAAGVAVLSVRPDTRQAPATLSFTSPEGRSVNLAEFKGKPTVVNLWATWFSPCVREMPMLHQAEVNQTCVNFVFLNQGESADKVGV